MQLKMRALSSYGSEKSTPNNGNGFFLCLPDARPHKVVESFACVFGRGVLLKEARYFSISKKIPFYDF